MSAESSSGNKRGPAKGADSLKTHRTEIDELKAEIQRLKQGQGEHASKDAFQTMVSNYGELQRRVDVQDSRLNKSAGALVAQRVDALEEQWQAAKLGPFAGMTFEEVIGGIACAMASALAPKSQSMDERFILARLEANYGAFQIFRKKLTDPTYIPPWRQKELDEQAEVVARREAEQERIESVEHGTGATQEEVRERKMSKREQALASVGVGHIGGGVPPMPTD